MLETVVQGLAQPSRATPPTTGDDQERIQAQQLQQSLQEAAEKDPAVRTSLTITQALYNHVQAKLAVVEAKAEIAEIEDRDERKLVKDAWESGDFRTVDAARRAVQGDIRAKQPEKPKPDPDTQRERVEQVRTTDTNLRGVSRPTLKKRLDDKEYASQVGDREKSMEERIKLRRDREAAKA
jgi:hypothetical protein